MLTALRYWQELQSNLNMVLIHRKPKLSPILLHFLLPQWPLSLKEGLVMDFQETKVFQWFVNSFGLVSMLIVMIVWVDQA